MAAKPAKKSSARTARTKQEIEAAGVGKPWTSPEAREMFARELGDAARSFEQFWRNREQFNAKESSPAELAVARVLRALTVAYWEGDSRTLERLEKHAAVSLRARPTERMAIDDMAGILSFPATDLVAAKAVKKGPAGRVGLSKQFVGTLEWHLANGINKQALVDVCLSFMWSPFAFLTPLAEHGIDAEAKRTDPLVARRLAKAIVGPLTDWNTRSTPEQRLKSAHEIAHATFLAVGLTREQARRMFGRSRGRDT